MSLLNWDHNLAVCLLVLVFTALYYSGQFSKAFHFGWMLYTLKIIILAFKAAMLKNKVLEFKLIIKDYDSWYFRLMLTLNSFLRSIKSYHFISRCQYFISVIHVYKFMCMCGFDYSNHHLAFRTYFICFIFPFYETSIFVVYLM